MIEFPPSVTDEEVAAFRRFGTSTDGTASTPKATTTGSADHEADESKLESALHDDQSFDQPPRRSSRRSVKPSRMYPEISPPPVGTRKRLASSKIMTESTRRNPKRKATEPSKLLDGLSSDLLEEALRPLEPKEIQDWEGWIELESEPAFFNIILRDLGVRNVKAQELFSVDEDSMRFLPKPIFGLIFLFQYHPGLDETQDEDDPSPHLWFANQTTHNACATVSLLNILLNVPRVQLGPSLNDFKKSTQPLSTALRGHRLSSDPFIRSVHNSFTRRMDHLNADLALENESNEPRPKRAKGGGKKGAKGGGKAKKKAIEDFAYHFIAYVERDGFVWELDGLKTKPHKLGHTDDDDWTSVVRPQLAKRMSQYEDSQLSFNLLALCEDPLIGYSKKIAEGIASLAHLDLVAALKEGVVDDWKPKDSVDSQADKPEFLAEFRLTTDEVLMAAIPGWVRDRAAPIDSTEKALALHRDVEVETKATMGEFRAELIQKAQDEQRVEGRRKDYGPALHKWVSKLTEKDMLEDLIRSTGA